MSLIFEEIVQCSQSFHVFLLHHQYTSIHGWDGIEMIWHIAIGSMVHFDTYFLFEDAIIVLLPLLFFQFIHPCLKIV